MQTKYGISVLITIKGSSEDPARVFLPKRFTLVFSDVDMDMINDGMIKINLVYMVRAKRPMLIYFRYKSVITLFDLTFSDYGPAGGNVF